MELQEEIRLPYPVDLRLFQPRGIAIVGATPDAKRIGGQPVRALTSFGYEGRVYPVNPRHDLIGGLRAYRSLGEIDDQCDLAVIAVPAARVPAVLADCGKAGIPYAIVLSAGFRETGESGRLLEEEVLKSARSYGVRLLGPNCQGLLNLSRAVYAGFGAPFQEPGLPCGPIALITQSGGFGFSIVMGFAERNLGFRIVVSTGNELDITTPELLSVLADDPNIEIFCIYLEGVKDGQLLIEAVQKATKLGKPVLVWKAGKSPEGMSAAASHTAQLTGSYEVYQYAFKQAGAIEVQDISDLADACSALLAKRVPKGPRIGSIGISGGAGIVLADRLPHANLSLASLSSETSCTLRKLMPTFASINNPVDVTASVFNDPSLITAALEAVGRDPQVDIVAVLLASLPAPSALGTARICADLVRDIDKPILVAWTGRNRQTSEAYEIFQHARIPVFDSPARLADAAGHLVDFNQHRATQSRAGLQRREVVTIPRISLPADPDEANVLDLLADAGIPTLARCFIPLEKANQIPDHLKYPVALKIVSPDIFHKTEVGGVQLGIDSKEALEDSISRLLQEVLLRRPDARIRGFLVSSMVRNAFEVIVGVVRDATFGPVVTVGPGGVLAEVMKDTSSRIAPFDELAAREMVAEIRAARILSGCRGAPPRDIEAIVSVLVRLSELAVAFPSIKELEINPLFVFETNGGALAGDALAVIQKL